MSGALKVLDYFTKRAPRPVARTAACWNNPERIQDYSNRRLYAPPAGAHALSTVVYFLMLFVGGAFLLETDILICNTIGRTALFESCNLTQTPWVPMNIISLVLTHNYIQEVNSTSFPPLSSLEVLRLDGQWTGKLTVHKDSFKNLPNLISLDLSYNTILVLNEDSFTGLSHLENLVLYSNQLNSSFLENNYFKDLTNLVLLDLAYNSFTYLKPHPKFYNLYRFELLDLRGNKISRICEGDLHSFQQKKIKVMDLSSNRLYQWSDIDWEHCGNPFRNIEFDTIILGGNSLNEQTIKSLCNVLNGTKIFNLKLRHHAMGHDFGYKKIKDPDESTFAGLENSDLAILDISKGYIFILQSSLFGKLSKLLLLNLAENKINRIEEKAFHGLQSLQYLNMSFNLLGELYNDAFDGLPNLLQIHLNNNHIGPIQQNAFKNLPKLQYVDLTNNAIVNLQFCEILPMVQFIGFRQNKLSTINVAKVKAPTIDFSENQLTNLADFLSFFKNAITQNISLRKNRLSTCTYKVSIPQNNSLLFLDLSDNMIQLIWEKGQCLEMFNNLSALQILYLSSNHLRFFPYGIFHGLTSLQILNLSSNALADITSDVLPVSVHTLDISRNQLFSPNPDVFLHLGTIDIRHNQFICQCPLVNFLTWLNETNTTVTGDREDIYCAYPDNLRYKPLYDIDASVCDEQVVLELLMFSLYVLTSVVIVTFMTVVIVYNHFRGFFFVLYKSLIQSVLEEEPQEEKNSKYDAYLCYASKDFPWVEKVFIKNLDSDYSEHNRFNLCFEERNFIPGEDHIVNVRDAIWNSKKTICVVTKHFLQDGWCVEAFNYAQSRYFTELKNVLIMVVVGSLSQYQLRKYKPIRAYMQRCEYLTWPEDDQDVDWFLNRISYKILREEKVKNRDVNVRTISSTLELQQPEWPVSSETHSEATAVAPGSEQSKGDHGELLLARLKPSLSGLSLHRWLQNCQRQLRWVVKGQEDAKECGQEPSLPTDLKLLGGLSYLRIRPRHSLQRYPSVLLWHLQVPTSTSDIDLFEGDSPLSQSLTVFAVRQKD
ncbi:toll-like receptor 5 [Dendropsophus ebraccatus]|uniref:toll-like receptor 5 n=1 Tax=Dendropsophus ebraccatus TaxID=150705 RepID=UPI00383230C0